MEKKPVFVLTMAFLIAFSVFSTLTPKVRAYENADLIREFFADAPHRIEPGESVPLTALVHDADRLLQPFTLQGIDIIDHKTNSTVASYEYNEYVDDHFWYKIYNLDSGLFSTLDGIASIDVKFRIKMRPDERVGPINVKISPDSLPKLGKWYAGDAHVHSSMTDDIYEFGPSVDSIASSARTIGLDWIILTDHSYDIDPFPDEWNDYKGYCDAETMPNEFMCMLGEEITANDTDRERASHYLAYGVSEPVKAEQISKLIPYPKLGYVPTQQEVIDEVKSKGGIGFIAHPLYPIWDWENWAVEGYTGIEIWNDVFETYDQQAVNKWTDLLNSGKKVFGIGNTDAHRISSIAKNVRIYTCLDDLTEKNIIEALENGHFIVTDGPLLIFEANSHIIGDTFTLIGTDIVNLDIEWKSTDEYGKVTGIIVIVNGIPIDTISVDSLEGSISKSYTVTTSSYVRLYCETDLSRKAYTNPIWIDLPPTVFVPQYEKSDTWTDKAIT